MNNRSFINRNLELQRADGERQIALNQECQESRE